MPQCNSPGGLLVKSLLPNKKEYYSHLICIRILVICDTPDRTLHFFFFFNFNKFIYGFTREIVKICFWPSKTERQGVLFLIVNGQEEAWK